MIIGFYNETYFLNKRLAYNEHKPTKIIALCSPGNQLYAETHDLVIAPWKKLRIVDRKDVVPRIPLNILGYIHESREIWIQSTGW